MLIFHVTRYCHLEAYRGTENYILELILAAQESGVEGSIAWLKGGERHDPLIDEYGIRVTHLPCSPAPVDTPPDKLVSEAERYLVGENQPDILHFHTFGLTEAALAQWAVGHNIPYIFTYHSPAWSCRRGDLLRWEKTVCDGEIKVWRCSACMLQQRLRCPKAIAWFAVGLLAPLGLMGRFFGGKIRRRTAFLKDTSKFRQGFRTFLLDAAKIVVCCDWSTPVMIINGAPAEHIIFCPQGVPLNFTQVRQETRQTKRNTSYTTFTVGYIGRITWTKGVHILVEAFRKLEAPQARLRIVGWESEREKDSPYVRNLRQLAGNDPRIKLIGPRPLSEMIEEYLALDLLAIPSIWLETGPLTLLEAIQMGVAVYGTDTIGQKNLIEKYGEIVYPNTVESWEKALVFALKRQKAGIFLKPNVNQIRTMQDVAREMGKINSEIKAN